MFKPNFQKLPTSAFSCWGHDCSCNPKKGSVVSNMPANRSSILPAFLMLEGAMSFKGKHINLLEGKDMFCHLEEEMP